MAITMILGIVVRRAYTVIGRGVDRVIKFLENLKRPIEELPTFEVGREFKIVLRPQETTEVEKQEVEKMDDSKEYRIIVKKYMTMKATPSFDFMSKFNNDSPMPLVEMVGYIEKETRGMYYMNLEGRINENARTCMKCGRTLTNKISMLYGLGPECGEHAYISPFSSEEELQANLELIRENIGKLKWSGWVIKSSVKSWEEI